jgi:hypothetical protein
MRQGWNSWPTKEGDAIFETLMGENMVSDGETMNYRIALIGSPTGDGDKYAIPTSIVKHLNEKRPTFSDLAWFAMTLKQINSDNIKFVTVIKDAQLFQAWLISGGMDTIEFSDTVSSGEQAYYRVEVYGNPEVEGLNQLIYGMRLAVSNPIYVGY